MWYLHRDNDNTAMHELDRLLNGISTYQDVVVAGQTVRRGSRDCERRWQAIAPHLPPGGVLLDVGANFGWFCLKWCAEGTDRLAVAWEADLRSAAVARYALAAEPGRRIALCTSLAGAVGARRIVESGRRIDVVLCLSILHWIPDHREFLAELGNVADRFLIEQPNVDETGAGSEAVRRSIGAIGPYLKQLFPYRPVTHLDTWSSHRDADSKRELWLVGPPNGVVLGVTPPSLDAALLCDLDVAWPPQSWWRRQMPLLRGASPCGFALTPRGVEVDVTAKTQTAAAWRRALVQLPELNTTTWRRRWKRWRLAVQKRVRRWRRGEVV